MTINRPAPHPLLSPVMEDVVPPRFRGNMADLVESPSEPNTPTSTTSQPQTIAECIEEFQEDHHPAGSSEKTPTLAVEARSSGQRQQGYRRSSPSSSSSSSSPPSSGYYKKKHDGDDHQHKGDHHVFAVFVCCRRFHTQGSLANRKSKSVKVHPFQRKPMTGSSPRNSRSKVKFSMNPFWILARLRDRYIGCMKSAASRNLTVIGGNIGTVAGNSQEFTFTSQEFTSTDSLADLLALDRSGSSKQTRIGSRNGSRNGGRSLSRKGSLNDIDQLFEKSKLRRSARKGDAENPYTDPYSRSKSSSASSSAELANLSATAGQETATPISQLQRCKSTADSEYRLKRLSASGKHRVSFDPSIM